MRFRLDVFRALISKYTAGPFINCVTWNASQLIWMGFAAITDAAGHVKVGMKLTLPKPNGKTMSIGVHLIHVCVRLE